jgi:hypothetical protein
VVSDIFVQTAYFSLSLYFPLPASRCIPASRRFPSNKEQPVAVKHKISQKTRGKRRTPTRSSKKAIAPRRAKSSVNKSEGGKRPMPAGDPEITIDRRRDDRRDRQSGAVENSAALEKLERRQKVNRRRQIDPTTCERDYTDQEVEFMNAIDDYKRRSGRMFPTCSEVLEVIRSLGYVKLSRADLVARMESSAPAPSAKPLPADWSQPGQEAGSEADDAAALSQQST